MKSQESNRIYEIFSCICEPVVTSFYYVCGCCFTNKHKCEICESRFKSKSHLAYHIRESHSEIYAWGSSKKFKEMLELEKLI